MTFTGWIQTGPTIAIAGYQSKIQIFFNLGGWEKQKILFFGNSSTHFVLREEISNTITSVIAECSLPHLFNTNYRFIVSIRRTDAVGLFYSLTLRLDDGTVMSCSSQELVFTNILTLNGSYFIAM